MAAELAVPERPFVKLATQVVADVVALAPLSDEAKAVAAQHQAPGPLLQALAAAGHWMDAARWLGHALMKREAVWWACLAARVWVGLKGGDAAVPPNDLAALAAAEAWVFRPSEEHRRAAWEKAQATEFASPAAWAATAAFWSGGSMGPPNVPAVPPPEFACGRAVAGAVVMAAVVKPEIHEQTYAKLLAAGLDIAAGGNGRAALG